MAKDLTGKRALICGDDVTLHIGPTGFDLTGYTLTFTVKSPTSLTSDSDAGAPLQVVYVCPSDADSVAGDAYIPIPGEGDPGETTRVTAGKYVFDIQFDGPKKFSSKKRAIEFVEDVTKS